MEVNLRRSDLLPRAMHTNRNTVTRVALGLVVVALPITAVLVLVAGAITPGYDSVSQTISQLARPGMPYTDVLTAAFLIQAVATLGLAALLYRLPGGGRRFAVPSFFLTTYAVATLGTALFPAQSSHTVLWGLTADQIHQDSAHYGVFAVLMAIGSFGYFLRNRVEWRPLTRASYLAIGASLLVGATFPTNAWPGIHGVLERVLLGITVAWTEFLAIRLWLRQRESVVPANDALIVGSDPSDRVRAGAF